MVGISQTFKTWLAERLRETNLSQSEASRRAGLNQNAISDLINDKVGEVSLKTAKALSRLFGVALVEVLQVAGYIEYDPQDQSLSELIELSQQLSPEDRRELVDYARWRYSKSNNKR